MEKYFLDKDIRTFCVTAATFPEGVSAAHQQLRSLLPSAEGSNLFGISMGAGKGDIVYKAAVEELYDGEAGKYGCEIFIIRQGIYIAAILQHWRRNELLVGETFRSLLHHPEIDEEGYCVEVYMNETDVKCMVTLK
ncbi:MAG: transcriptional regulator [Chitinophagaceae bacterium]|nr:transcriptional regulator [Chitinophagaceae bacterium]